MDQKNAARTSDASLVRKNGKLILRNPQPGDLGWIVKHVAPDIIPDDGRVISYKRDIACSGMPGFHNVRSKGDGTVPVSASLVSFHGLPRPWDVDGLF